MNGPRNKHCLAKLLDLDLFTDIFVFLTHCDVRQRCFKYKYKEKYLGLGHKYLGLKYKFKYAYIDLKYKFFCCSANARDDPRSYSINAALLLYRP